MRPVTRRTAISAGAAAVSTAVLASCSEGNSSDTEFQEQIDEPDENINTDSSEAQIVKDKVTIRFMSGRHPSTAEDWDDVGCVKLAEEATNVHIDFGLVAKDGIDEKRNLTLAGGDYPGVFYRTSVGSGDIVKYANQGVFKPLNELIDAYMPNFRSVMERNDGVREAITFPDGNIYSLPQVYDEDFAAMRTPKKLWVRKDWLDRFGMEVPKTIDEFQAYLEEAVHGDPEGTGEKSGVVGVANDGIGLFVDALGGTFGFGNKGPDVGNFDLDPDTGNVRFHPMSDGYREMLEWVTDLYSAGLVLQDIFSTDSQKINALGAEGLVAASLTHAPVGSYGQEMGEKYVCVPPLKNNSGAEVPRWNIIRPAVATIGNFVMTDQCEHPIEVARWMDYWYGEEGAKSFFAGIEHESYEIVDGELEIKDEITKGKTLDEALKPYALYIGGEYPGYATEKWFRGIETSDQAVEATQMLSEYAIDDVWPSFTFTEDEAAFLATTGNDISKYVGESTSAFVTGARSTSEWEEHVSQYENMGIAEYLDIHQAAYDRRQ